MSDLKNYRFVTEETPAGTKVFVECSAKDCVWDWDVTYSSLEFILGKVKSHQSKCPESRRSRSARKRLESQNQLDYAY